MIIRLIKYLIAFSFLALPGVGLASLNFGATTDLVNYGTGTSLDNLDPMTVCAWVYPTSTSADRIYQKGLSVNAQLLSISSGASSFEVVTARLTVNATASAPQANFAAFGTSKWLFMCGQTDTTTAVNNRLFIGDLTHFALEPSSYVVQQAGSGTVGNNNTAAAIVGNRSSGSRVFVGRIAWIGIWNRLLSAGEIRDQQFHPHKTSGNVLFSHLGFNGTGTQADWSGQKNNGTVTGAVVAPHMPLGNPFVLPAGENGDLAFNPYRTDRLLALRDNFDSSPGAWARKLKFYF